MQQLLSRRAPQRFPTARNSSGTDGRHGKTGDANLHCGSPDDTRRTNRRSIPRTETSDHRRFHSHSSEQTGSTERTTGASTDIKTGVHFSTTTSEPCRDLRHWTPRRTPHHKRMGHASKLTTAPTDHIRNRLPPSIRLRASRCLISPGTWSALTMLHVLSANRWLHETRLATRGRISD
jgi:hypothetical protein